MGTGAVWADVCLNEEVEAWFSLSDIKDYFYGCSIPMGLSRYFALLDVETDFVQSLHNPQYLDDVGSPGGPWCPVLRVLPMGWSWSFYFAQVAHATEVERALAVPPEHILQARRPAPRLRGDVLLALPYCDNLTVAATCAKAANDGRERVAQHCRELGFVVHEETEADRWAQSLGFLLDGATGLSVPRRSGLGASPRPCGTWGLGPMSLGSSSRGCWAT